MGGCGRGGGASPPGGRGGHGRGGKRGRGTDSHLRGGRRARLLAPPRLSGARRGPPTLLRAPSSLVPPNFLPLLEWARPGLAVGKKAVATERQSPAKRGRWKGDVNFLASPPGRWKLRDHLEPADYGTVQQWLPHSVPLSLEVLSREQQQQKKLERPAQPGSSQILLPLLPYRLEKFLETKEQPQDSAVGRFLRVLPSGCRVQL